MTLCALAMIISLQVVSYAESKGVKIESNKKERNYIRSGNKLYEQKRYADAEVEYRKAIQKNPNSPVAKYNLASALVRQSGGSNAKNDSKNPLNTADSLYREVAKTCPDTGLAARSFYNLGNIAFNSENYQQSVECYKNCLRRTPDDEQARQNLRLAPKKLEEQQQNQDNNQNQQDKQQQNQQQNQNQDQNKDKKDKDKQQPDKQQGDDKKDSDKKDQQQNGGMSEANMERILENMQNQENALQQKVNAAKAREEKERSKIRRKQW